jgi:hypothetical protein
VEADVYVALRQRIGLFETVVGRLQPILARLPSLISSRVLEGKARTEDGRQAAVNEIETEAAGVSQSGFDIDKVTDADLIEPPRATSPLTMEDLDRVIANATLLPPGVSAEPMDKREYKLRQPGLISALRVSTDPLYYEQNADNVELWSPGNPLFPTSVGELEAVGAATLCDLLEG